MDRETETAQLAAVFRNLGADAKQAETMARQTQKRADQLCEQRGMERPAAISYLLQLVVSGRSGDAPPGLSGEFGDSA